MERDRIKMNFHGLTISCFVFFVCIEGFKLVDLNGKWQITNSENKFNFTGDVPGGIYTALLENNIIDDPYYRDNDVQYRWVAYENWTYTRSFQIDRDVLATENVLLVAEGLDTFSTLAINGEIVGHSDNMFLSHTIDVTSIIQKSGKYNITASFISAATVSSRLSSQSDYPIPDDQPPEYHGIPNINFIRKMQYAFAWDWAPAFPNQGIWRDIYIEIIKSPVIQNMSILPHLVDGNWSVDVDLNFETTDGKVEGIIEFIIQGYGCVLKEKNTGRIILDKEKTIKHTVQIPPDFAVDLWWPNGYGNQTLYNLTVIFVDVSNETSSRWKMFGFRTVELVEDVVSYTSNQGLTYYYRINGVPIFMKGSNWIPSDMFLERITPERTRRFLVSAKEANINSMRMNGVGIYEEDYFYDMVDELGIMIIQDFMFSDAMYPTTPSFLDSVKREIRQQMQRIKHHPSIIAWALNNENEELIKDNWHHVQDVSRYMKDYVTLYIDTIRPVMLNEDDTRPWLPSSPSNGIIVEKAANWFSNSDLETVGDIHIYDYMSDLWNVSNFKTPRFAAEYGLESWCNFETIESVFEKDDLDYWSNMSVHRQHHPQGAQELVNEASTHMKMPNSPDAIQRFKDMIYVTQIEQAMGIRAETEHYRRYQNQLDEDGRGLTMGALYWQLVDVWQAPTWSSIDFNIKWKMLHYYAKHFLGPNLISPYIENDTLHIYMVNDEIPTTEYRNPLTRQLQFRPLTSEEVYNKYSHDQHEEIIKKIKQSIQGTVIMELYNWTSLIPVKSWNIPYKLNKTSGSIFKKKLDDVLSEEGCTVKKNCFLYFYLNSKSNPISTTWLPLTYFTDVQGVIPKATIKIQNVITISELEFKVTISTNYPAPFVWINSYNIPGRFSDNGFVIKDQILQLTFTSWQPVGLNTLKKSLSVHSFMDIYY